MALGSPSVSVRWFDRNLGSIFVFSMIVLFLFDFDRCGTPTYLSKEFYIGRSRYHEGSLVTVARNAPAL